MKFNDKVVEYLIGKLYEDLERKTHELLEADKQIVEMDEAFKEAMREIAEKDLKIEELEENAESYKNYSSKVDIGESRRVEIGEGRWAKIEK